MNKNGWKSLHGKFVVCKCDWGDDLTGIKAGTRVPVFMEIPPTPQYPGGGYRAKIRGVTTTIPRERFSEPLDANLLDNPLYGEF